MDRKEFKHIFLRDSFHTLRYLGPVAGEPALEVVFNNIEPEPEPERATDVRTEFWQKQVEKRKEDILKRNPDAKLEARLDPATGSLSLYETIDGKEKRIMFDGSNTNTTLATRGPYRIEGNQFIINNFQIPYSRWVACLDPRYADSFESAGMPLPYAGMGISTLIVPKDGLIAVTRRDVRTPIYPGMLYCPGGGVKPGMTSAQAALDEIVDETGLEEGVHFDPYNLKTVAFVADTNHVGTRHSRPEVLATLTTPLTSEEINSIYIDHVRSKGKEPDVSNIEYLASADSLQTKGTMKATARQMCPPTAASFAYLLYDQLLAETGSEDKAYDMLRDFMTDLQWCNN